MREPASGIAKRDVAHANVLTFAETKDIRSLFIVARFGLEMFTLSVDRSASDHRYIFGSFGIDQAFRKPRSIQISDLRRVVRIIRNIPAAAKDRSGVDRQSHVAFQMDRP